MTLLSQREALDLLLSKASPLGETESVETGHALERILAQDIVSPMDVPPCDNSAMDGFAIAVEGSTGRLEISQRIPAGVAPLPLGKGTAARIFTGAQVPLGADAVVMQEDCVFDGERVIIATMPKPGANIRKRGENVRAGSVFLRNGVKLRPQELGLIASVGISRVEVYRRLKVSVFFTGNELVMPGNPLDPGKIYNSNRYSLIGLFEAMGCEVIDLGIVPDELEKTVAALEEGRRNADIVMSCGGVSVGEEDHVRDAVVKMGSIEFWKVAVKPGKPFAFGNLEGTPFIGLPGNPVSAFLMFCLFARPFILRSQGARQSMPQGFPAKADFSWKGGKRAEWLRARLSEGGILVHPDQGSASLASLSWAEGLVEIPAGSEVSKGDEIRFFPFSELLS